MHRMIIPLLLLSFAAHAETPPAAFSLAAVYEKTRNSPAGDRAGILTAAMATLEKKLKELEVPETFQLERVRHLEMKQILEPIVNLANAAPNARDCATASHETELAGGLIVGSREPTAAEASGKELLELFCPPIE